MSNELLRQSAIEDFRRARREAALERIVARLGGKSADLLSYEDVKRHLKMRGSAGRGLRDIPLDAIVGSVARYTDFTRSFLPRNPSDAERWVRVKAAMESQIGLPPIDVYKVGDAYFVLDGNHRVSVARQQGHKTIQANVHEVLTKVPLSLTDRPDDLIRKAEYAAFLEKTSLDKSHPAADLTVTVPGQYPVLQAHIEAHRSYLSADRQRPVPYADAATHWYETVYMPVAQTIRDQKLLEQFPGRTETDLYLWISQHRRELEEQLGWNVELSQVAADLAANTGAGAPSRVSRLGQKLRGALTPEVLDNGPAPGAWRQQADTSTERCLFHNLLVPIAGDELGWQALDQALAIARREQGTVQGLHVIRPGAQLSDEFIQALQGEFSRRCTAAGIAGRLATEVGAVAETIIARSRWTDLVVLNIAHPPSPEPIARLRSGLRSLVQRCPQPVLCVPRMSPLRRPLLAYDGSRKAEEALFVATYLAARKQFPLVVVTVVESGRTAPAALERARAYLESHGVEATFVEEHGPVAEAILRTADALQNDCIIAGGYGFTPVLEVMLGSTVDELLRVSRQPLLICR